MAKPPFREQDEFTKRVNDVTLELGPFKGDFSGQTAINVLLVLALIGFGIWHHFETQKEFALNREVSILQTSYQSQNVCVVRLNEEQRQEDRVKRNYCPDPTEEIRRYIQYKKADRE
jgi:Tfp pilus assembly protein PilO